MEQTKPPTLAETAPPTPPGYQNQNPVQQMTKDEMKEIRTLYSSSYGSIILKNFLAGFFRALGGIILYLIFLAIVGQIFATYVLPEIRPLFDSIEKLTNLQTSLNQSATSDPVTVDPETVDQIMEQLKQQ